MPGCKRIASLRDAEAIMRKLAAAVPSEANAQIPAGLMPQSGLPKGRKGLVWAGTGMPEDTQTKLRKLAAKLVPPPEDACWQARRTGYRMCRRKIPAC